MSVTTTVGSPADAQRLAQALLGSRLAACVQVEEGLVSHYRWRGQTHRDAEVRLTIKTTRDHVPALQAHLAAHHPYELPQFLVAPLQASRAYADWVKAELAPVLSKE